MKGYMIVDAHLHCFRSREAAKLALGAFPFFSDYTGTVDDALMCIRKTAMTKAIMVNTIPLAYMWDSAVRKLPADLTKEQRQEKEEGICETLLDRLARLNAWSCEMGREHPELVPTITLDPILSAEALRREVVDKVKNGGAKGIKLHPPIGRYYPNDERMWPAYQAASDMGIPVVFHCGPHPHPDDPKVTVEYARPGHFEPLVERFPKLSVILGHMGVGPGPDWKALIEPYYQEVLALAKKGYPNLHLDASECVSDAMGGHGLSDDQIVELIKAIGPDHVLFGSDFPVYDPAIVIGKIMSYPFTDKEKRLILGENCVALFRVNI
jgi:predicted TIM-barrel fold metal-dependent hydrolase